MNVIRTIAVVATAALMTSPNWAQEATVAQKGLYASKEGFGTLHMQCHLGSFKSIDGQGRLEVNFTGTLLVTRSEKPPILTGNIRKEYDEGGRVCYTGTGKAVIDGKWRGVQWLGSEMTGVWWGTGIMRITGEFWKNPQTGQLETGRYWYNKEANWQPFPNAGVMNLTLPEVQYGAEPDIKPKVRTGGGN